MGLLITFWVLLALGFVFCFVGRFPGQILAFAALLIGYFGTDVIKYPDWVVIVSAILVVVSLYIGWKIAPKLGKRYMITARPASGAHLSVPLSLFCAQAAMQPSPSSCSSFSRLHSPSCLNGSQRKISPKRPREHAVVMSSSWLLPF